MGLPEDEEADKLAKEASEEAPALEDDLATPSQQVLINANMQKLPRADRKKKKEGVRHSQKIGRLATTVSPGEARPGGGY